MGLTERAKLFRVRFTSTFSFENIVLLLTVGLVLLQVISYVGSVWFGWQARYFGPYLLLVIVAAIMMVVFLFLRKGHNFVEMTKIEWAMLIFAAVMIVSAIVVFRNSPLITPALFKSAASNLASIVGIG